ncbi:hypothetical protein AYJ57_23150 (plasmid) [Salipiger sp. CCB-MM3]|nr:hypothetical protein AYJ57_23150 [Salipiger sp. CCB-MM3]
MAGLVENIPRGIYSGGFFSSISALIGARAVLTLLQLASVPLLARVLDMHDFAIMALGMTIPLFANTLSDAGLGRSLVRRQEFNVDEWSTVFWFLGLVGLALAAAVVAAAPIYAKVMHEQELIGVVSVLAAVPFIQACISTHQSALERDFRFDQISKVTVASGILGVLLALGLALAGAGYWALVAQQIATAGLRGAAFAWLSGFRPRLAFSRRLLMPHLNFGKNTLLFSGVMTLQSQTPVLAFGQVLSSHAVSLWSMTERASRPARTGLAGPVAQVTLVSMSRQWREGRGAEEVAALYLAATRLLATLLFPGFIVLAFAGETVFVWLLSEPWRPVANIFALAVPALLLEAISSTGARVFMVSDRTDLRLRMAVERLLLGTIVFLAALPFGLEMAVAMRSLFAVAYMPRYWGYLCRCVPLDRWAAARVLVLPTAVGVVVGLATQHVIAEAGAGETVSALLSLACAAVSVGLAGLVGMGSLRSDVARLRASVHRRTDV